jgi:hypothetical protein
VNEYDFTRERTVTRSPGEKGRLGKKLAPAPSEWVRTRPAWRPDRLPVTTTLPTFLVPRKLIWVCGVAVTVPGKG